MIIAFRWQKTPRLGKYSGACLSQTFLTRVPRYLEAFPLIRLLHPLMCRRSLVRSGVPALPATLTTRLLLKLKSRLPSSVCLIIQSYLLNRYHGEHMAPCPTLSGVPQGSVLGPTLHLVSWRTYRTLSPYYQSYLRSDTATLFFHPGPSGIQSSSKPSLPERSVVQQMADPCKRNQVRSCHCYTLR